MDPVTHTLTGAVLSRAGLHRVTPLATATLILAANAPDIDILAYAHGEYAALALRRGWTHGPLALLVLPFVVAGIVLAWDGLVRRRRRADLAPARARPVVALAVLGVATHPLLDWLNTYGVRLLMPFGPRWFYGDALFIIDPWVWLLLGGALPLSRRSAGRGEKIVQVAGIAVLAYIFVMVSASAAAERIVRAHAMAAGLLDRHGEVLYQPRPANPFSGDLVVVTPAGYQSGRFSWAFAPRVSFREPVLARGDWTDPVVTAALRRPEARDFLVWSRFPYTRADTTAQGISVFFGDARYAGEPRVGSLHGVRVLFEATATDPP